MLTPVDKQLKQELDSEFQISSFGLPDNEFMQQTQQYDDLVLTIYITLFNIPIRVKVR